MNLTQVRQNVLLDGRPLTTLARGSIWAAHCITRRDAVVSLWPDGPRMRLRAKAHAHGSTSIYMKRIEYEPHLQHLRSLIRPGMTILDIGANVGVYSLALAAAVGSTGRIHAFEPGREAFDRLEFNCIKLNPNLPITTWSLALSDRIGSSRLFHVGGSTTFSMGGDDAQPTERIPVSTLDSWAHANGLTGVDAIKIDVEGHEPNVLRGGRNLLTTHHPLILFESSQPALERNSNSMHDCWEILQEYDYSIFEMAGSLIPAATPAQGNFYAIARDSIWNRYIR